jgi:hypothetical protein
MQTWVVAEYSEPCNDETERPARRVFRTTPHPSPRDRKSSPTQTLEAPDIELACVPSMTPDKPTLVVAEYSEPCNDETERPARRVFRTTPHPSPRGRKSSPTQTLEAPDIEICLCPVDDEGGPARRVFHTTPYPSEQAP